MFKSLIVVSTIYRMDQAIVSAYNSVTGAVTEKCRRRQMNVWKSGAWNYVVFSNGARAVDDRSIVFDRNAHFSFLIFLQIPLDFLRRKISWHSGTKIISCRDIWKIFLIIIHKE